MLECHSMDILPYSHDTISTFLDIASSNSAYLDSRSAFPNIGDAADWCIFCVEVRNTYGLPFEVTFEREESCMYPPCLRFDVLLT